MPQNREFRRKSKKIINTISIENHKLEFNAGNRSTLVFIGPVIFTEIGISDSYRKVLLNAGEAVPENIRCKLLIDTGAESSIVKHEIAEKACLKLFNMNVPIAGIGAQTDGRGYHGRIHFISQTHNNQVIQQTWVDTEILSANIPSQDIDGVIGRDVLAHFLFRYDGINGKFSLTYIKPKS